MPLTQGNCALQIINNQLKYLLEPKNTVDKKLVKSSFDTIK